ncbi:serine/arginine repetitive matrix protein 1-like isoform X10 [Telopea speciosissima]|uniref:serine/arginine repetitive matrix protein 1-like isoform X10 n=1 Tax=Telopea speciosissima TaxID=54955 RepID=UPI001CC61F6E|nr:serine/arginine repetitive matrix protein 1-like isoform X10 [Telopea speciosissima]
MSGGFFRGTSADQDTRFSNKQAKLLKSQKFAPELEHLVDMTKVKIDTIKPWIAKRVTELLGFEDEVLINFIYGLLDRKEVNGKEVQIQLTGFMEKNTGKFMKELWTLLLSAQNNASGIPQQILDATDEELRKKKAEADRITHEIQKRKEKEGREFELENLKKMDGGNDDLRINNAASDPILRRSQARGSSEEKEADERNGSRKMSSASKSPHSMDHSPFNRSSLSRSVSKSFSNSRSYSDERHRSRSLSGSPQPRGRFISPERRYRSPRRRSVSPRHWPSPRKPRSPLRSRLYHSRHRSPSYSRRRSPSPVRRRLPSPSRRRSPSPVRRRSPPVRRRSPSPVRRRSRRSPSLRHRSPLGVRRRLPTPSRRRSPPSRWNSPSPVRRRSPSPLRRRSPPPRSPRHRRRSPLGSPRMRYSSSESPPRQEKERLSRHGSASPVRRPRKQTVRHDSSETSWAEEISHAREDEKYRNNFSDRHSPRSGNWKHSSVKDFRQEEYRPERVGGHQSAEARGHPDNTELRKKYRDKKSSKASMGSGRSESPIQKESPILGGIEYGPGRPGFVPDDVQAGQQLANKHGRDSPSLSERVQKSSSREGNKADEGKHSHSSKAEDRGRHDRTEEVQKSLKNVDRKNRPGDSDSDSAEKEKFRSDYVEKRKHKRSCRLEMASDDNAYDDSEIDERKEAKRRRKEEKRLRRDERRRRREERHRRREERRASKLKAKSGDTVTPPSDFEKLRNDADDSEREGDASKDSNPSDTEEKQSEQKKLEIELRKKALESLRAKKGINH